MITLTMHNDTWAKSTNFEESVHVEFGIVAEPYTAGTGPKNALGYVTITPEAARKLADELIDAAEKAQRWED